MTAEEFLQKALQDSLKLKSDFFQQNLERVIQFGRMLSETRRTGNQVLIFGNGGSAADAQHLAAELVHRVETKELRVRAHALHADTSLITALGNDEGYDSVYARQLQVLAAPGDLAVGITTSGNSANIVEALAAARKLKVRTVGLLGRDGGRALQHCDLALVVPHSSTPRIQEVHAMVIHLACQLLELE